jgi:hypothetical protein
VGRQTHLNLLPPPPWVIFSLCLLSVTFSGHVQNLGFSSWGERTWLSSWTLASCVGERVMDWSEDTILFAYGDPSFWNLVGMKSASLLWTPQGFSVFGDWIGQLFPLVVVVHLWRNYSLGK